METARVTNRGLALVPVLCLGLLGGCSYLPSNPFSREPEIALEDQSPQQIFLTGEALLADGRPRDAGETFSEVERLYPYSEWAKRAMLMSAFAYHEGALYAESRSAAGRYLDFFSGRSGILYAFSLLKRPPISAPIMYRDGTNTKVNGVAKRIPYPRARAIGCM